MRALIPAAIVVTLSFPTPDYVRPAPRTIEVAKGVYLFLTRPYGEVGRDGNAIAILSNDGVLVFDANRRNFCDPPEVTRPPSRRRSSRPACSWAEARPRRR